MDTREERRQRFQREQQTKKRLRMGMTRLHEAEQERLWAIVAAYDAGFSIRQIATATGLSRSRIHQLLQDPEVREIPTWLTHLRVGDHPSSGNIPSVFQQSTRRKAEWITPCLQGSRYWSWVGLSPPPIAASCWPTWGPES
jgi:hypothetical protein